MHTHTHTETDGELAPICWFTPPKGPLWVELGQVEVRSWFSLMMPKGWHNPGKPWVLDLKAELVALIFMEV